MDEDQAEYFIILAHDRYRAQTISYLSRSQRFMVETSYQDNTEIDRKFVVIAGQENHVLQEAKRYWANGVLLVCVLCIKTYNSKHLLRALKKVYGLSGNSKSSTMSFSGQEMTLHEGTSFDHVKHAAKVLGQNMNHHYRMFVEEQNERLGKTVEELKLNKRGTISQIASGFLSLLEFIFKGLACLIGMLLFIYVVTSVSSTKRN